jgi:hypothetical protein
VAELDRRELLTRAGGGAVALAALPPWADQWL